MGLREIFIVSKGTKVIFAITFSVSIMAVIFAFFYYRNINSSEDPRILKARNWLYQYNKLSGTSDIIDSFTLLDSADAVFRSMSDYISSFEIGLIYNNRCSALLLMAMYDSAISINEKTNLLDLSMKYCDSSIYIYNRWIKDWGSLSSIEISEKLKPYMKEEDRAFKGANFRKIFSRRIKNIVEAQIETPRRLSVALTNKGTVYRHMLKTDSSLIYYQEALLLWKDNRTAKSNMSVLLGGEPVKPTLIESLFPPDKNKN